jgi:hypothetical protein
MRELLFANRRTAATPARTPHDEGRQRARPPRGLDYSEFDMTNDNDIPPETAPTTCAIDQAERPMRTLENRAVKLMIATYGFNRNPTKFKENRWALAHSIWHRPPRTLQFVEPIRLVEPPRTNSPSHDPATPAGGVPLCK